MRISAAKELNPHYPEHSCAQLLGSLQTSWDPPKLPGFLAARQVSHRLMEAALCCTKLAPDICMGSGTLNQSQASS